MKNRNGFTLVELLVVVAIIALLISILLPSLSRARAVAQQVACLATLRGAGQCMVTYTIEHKDWLAGPNTSGAFITSGTSTYPTQYDGKKSPTYNMDWVSPTMGDALGLPENRDERIKAIFNNAFTCASNKEDWDASYNGSYTPITGLRVASYSAMNGFHITKDSKPTAFDAGYANYLPRVPAAYVPKLGAVGRAANKVYAMDGARYVQYGNGVISYNTFVWQNDGGNFMNFSPAVPKLNSDGDPYKRVTDTGPLTDTAERFAYRHVNSSINGVYFDGHAANIEEKDSRDPAMYWPSKSRVILTNAFYSTQYAIGATLP
ncbi:MAG: prepilin-type N-terminal cleavage/methylation domain-containing protein [Planctomycetes bacterium]|nr:prepilin-type N-terminal cleavage/methylation domain-containing protein [Planctomycetota bacterium]